MSVKLIEMDVNITVATLWDHLSVFVKKASILLVMDYSAMVKFNYGSVIQLTE